MPLKKPGRVCWGALLTVFCVAAGMARAQPLVDLGRSQFRADANLILVPITVTDVRGRTVEGLGAGNFTVLDDRQPQPISTFFSVEGPVSVGIVLDVSGSTAGILQREKAAVRAFLEHSGPGDDYFLTLVSSVPRVLAGRTGAVEEIDYLMQWQKSGGGTALCDTVYFALHQARSDPRARRVLLVVSDGMDNHSRYSKRETMNQVVEGDVQVYTIALVDPAPAARGLSHAEMQRGIAFMDELAERSGGLSVTVGANQDPSAAASRISAAVRNQYVLGYRRPESDSIGRWHTIRVKANVQDVRVHSRQGYQLR